MILTKQIRIFPTEEQERILWILSNKCRLFYNFALKERLDNYNLRMFYFKYICLTNYTYKKENKYFSSFYSNWF